jgi:hypothetical protein
MFVTASVESGWTAQIAARRDRDRPLLRHPLTKASANSTLTMCSVRLTTW